MKALNLTDFYVVEMLLIGHKDRTLKYWIKKGWTSDADKAVRTQALWRQAVKKRLANEIKEVSEAADQANSARCRGKRSIEAPRTPSFLSARKPNRKNP